jgi:aromatic ring-opening dioxygenase LigB subunit
MPLSQAAIVPHPPILIPNIGKENLTLLAKTTTSYRKLKEAFKANKIETIIIISSHGPAMPNVFSVNEGRDFEINFEEFGDYSTKINAQADIDLVREFKEGFSAYRKVQFVNEPKLDYGSGVPICSLLTELEKIKIVPVHISDLSLREHFVFGKKIKTIIDKSKKKIAVLASGDLSHTLTKKSPAPYSPKAVRFDQKLVEYIQNKKIGDILDLKEELISEVKPCGLKPIVILLGILKGVNYEIENLTYEAPFGVGYLTMQIEIN